MKIGTRHAGDAPADPAGVKPHSPVQPSRRDAVEDWLTLFVRMLALPPSETEAVRDELEDHLRSRVDDLLISGVSEPEAVRRAVAELGETAALAQGFRRARRRPRRRIAMHAALFAVAGSALVLSSTALYNGGGASTPASLQPEVVAIEGEPAEVAPFNENLRRYDISALLPPNEIDAVDPAGRPFTRSNMSTVHERIDEITEAIQNLVRYEDWQAHGGDAGKIHSVGSILFIEAPPEMHEGALWVLRSLRQDAARAEAEARRQADTVLRDREAREHDQRTRVERQRAEREAKIRQDIAELETVLQDLTERLVKHEEDKALLEMQEHNLRSAYLQEPTSEDAQKQLAQVRGRLVRLGIEQETARTRMLEARELLTALQFQRYASVAPAAPGVPSPAAPAARQDPFETVAPAGAAVRSGR